MGLFNLFKDNKAPKNNIEKETRDDEVFGNICRVGQASDWYTAEYDLNLYGDSHNVAISIETKTEDSSVTDDQRVAGKNFLENIKKYQDIITERIEKFFNTENTEMINNSISVESVHISRTGKICVIMECSEEFDETLLSGIADGVDFTDSFGIEIYPEVRMLPNEQELTAVAYGD